MCFWYREGGALRRSEIAERMMGLFAQGLEPRAVIPAAGRRPARGTPGA
jgi:hypothetical protein